MSYVESGSDFDTVSPRVRNKFLIWSLAIVGSLSTSGMVELTKPAWAQDDPNSQQVPQKSSDNRGEENAEEEKPLDRQVFNELMSKNQLGELEKKLDAALQQDPENAGLISMNTSFSLSLLRSKPQQAKERLSTQFQRLESIDTSDPSLLNSLSRTAVYLVQLESELGIEGQLELLDRALKKMQTLADDSAVDVRPLLSTKARLLLIADREEDAKAMMDAMLSKHRSQVDTDSGTQVRNFIEFASVYYSALAEKFPSEADAVIAEAEAMAKQALQRENASAQDFATLLGLESLLISRMTYSDPSRAVEILEGLEEEYDALAERLPDDELQRLKAYERQLDSHRSRIEPALKREQLIGTEAPEIDAEKFVAMDEVSMEDLKGKVLLVDFWAVWCGPCIATFPHLIEWHEKYADRGLMILGATKYYNYDWDEAAGRAKRSQETVEPEIELSMLEKFRESYGLHHGFMVFGKDSQYSQHFQVTGIPQAVLIDRSGRIAMIRVGSGPANAEALEEKILELLAE